MRRRSTRTSARGTPRRSPTCPRYAPLAARRRAVWRTRSAGAAGRRGRLCAVAPPMRARVRTRAGTRFARGLGCRYGRAEGRFDTCIRIYICVCVCVFHAYAYIIHLSVYVRIGRCYVCVHQCAMGMDRLCAHALAGSCCGLGLKPETLNRASPCRRRGLRAASARRRSAMRRRSTATSARGTPLASPRCPWYAPLAARRRALRRTRSAGAAGRRGPVVRGSTADARARAHTCRHSLCAGSWVQVRPRGGEVRYMHPNM